MGHWAEIKDSVVVNVIVADQTFIDNYPGVWVETSYSTDYALDQEPILRKNYATIGGTYDAERDAFIPVKPYTSWILDEESCTWQSPVPYPTDGLRYDWNEITVNWELASLPD